MPAAELSSPLHHPCYFPKRLPQLQVGTDENVQWLVISVNGATDKGRVSHDLVDSPKQGLGDNRIRIDENENVSLRGLCTSVASPRDASDGLLNNGCS